jgi:hypothetical protein
VLHSAELKEDAMAKPVKHAGLICLILTIVAAAGAAGGYFLALPVILAAALVPASVYELIRTEGASTRVASLLITVALAAEIIVLLAGIRVDLSSLLRSLSLDSALPAALLNLPGILAVVAAILAIVLFTRTRGVYTKWLSVVVFVGSLGQLYLLAPAEVAALLS